MARDFDYHRCFATSYEEARSQFRLACRVAGAQLEAYENQNCDENGQPLTTDVARFGSAAARNLLVLVAGTHGNEGLCGSGCQVAWVREGGPAALPPDTAVLLVHLINPYGTAFLQRETEEGVDLNRNFVDHARADYPRNDDYRELHDALTYPALAGPGREKADAEIARFKELKGEQAYLNAFASGQYSHPTGLYFGGNAPTWSNRTFTEILQRHGQTAARVAVIDYHTGFGPYGYGMLVTVEAEGTPSHGRAQRWFGGSLISLAGKDVTKVPPNVRGSLLGAVESILPDQEVTIAAVEFGTYDLARLIELRRAEAALRNDPDADSELVRSYKLQQQQFLIPATEDWTEMVWARSRQLIRQALTGLSA